MKHESREDNHETYGRYFGVCASFHHSKACLCLHCTRRPKHVSIMCCAKGSCPTYVFKGSKNFIGSIFETNEKVNECLCKTCFVYKQFSMKGNMFCKMIKE